MDVDSTVAVAGGTSSCVAGLHLAPGQNSEMEKNQLRQSGRVENEANLDITSKWHSCKPSQNSAQWGKHIL